MADKRKRKRAAPTIDLTATEVSPAQDEGAAAPESEAPSRQSAAEPNPPHSEDAHAAPEPQPAQPKEAHPHGPSAGVYAAAVAAGFAGAALVTAAFAALWFAGLLPGRPVQSNDAQLGALQKQIHELQNRPAPPPVADTQAVDALGRRIAKLEHDIANLPRGDKMVAERLASVDNALKSLGIAVTAFNKRGDDIAAKAAQAARQAAAAEKAVSDLRDSVQNSRQDTASAVDTAALDALQQRVATVEQAVKAARAQAAQASAADKAARLALSAAALRDAVKSGAPYENELAQAKSLGGDEKILAPLERFATSGVPAKAALAHELRALIPAMMKTSGTQKPPRGFLERLQANVGNLVRVNPVSTPQGDKPADVLARIEVDAGHANIDAALPEIAKLPAGARAPARAWVAKVKARQVALAAARTLAVDAVRALGTPPSADALRRP